jgi:predicted Holliday junction resolvase-like endonuclease
MELELLLAWAVITTIFLLLSFVALIKLQKKHHDDIEKLKQDNEKMKKFSLDAQRNSLKGKIGEQVSPLMPEFYTKYEPADARFMGSPIDFVIFKNMSKFDKETKDEENPIEVVLVDIKIGKSATLSPLQKSIREAILEKRVSFDVIKPKIELPKQEEKPVKELTLKNNNPQKIEAQKINPSAYESWTISDDEFLKNYWNDKSNKLSKNEKKLELTKKLGRNIGSITSRIKKLNLD